jgi:hypothetical protein
VCIFTDFSSLPATSEASIFRWYACPTDSAWNLILYTNPLPLLGLEHKTSHMKNLRFSDKYIVFSCSPHDQVEYQCLPLRFIPNLLLKNLFYQVSTRTGTWLIYAIYVYIYVSDDWLGGNGRIHLCNLWLGLTFNSHPWLFRRCGISTYNQIHLQKYLNSNSGKVWLGLSKWLWRHNMA